MEDYVHRIGRTGRAGSTGLATSFYTDRDMVLATLLFLSKKSELYFSWILTLIWFCSLVPRCKYTEGNS